MEDNILLSKVNTVAITILLIYCIAYIVVLLYNILRYISRYITATIIVYYIGKSHNLELLKNVEQVVFNCQEMKIASELYQQRKDHSLKGLSCSSKLHPPKYLSHLLS